MRTKDTEFKLIYKYEVKTLKGIVAQFSAKFDGNFSRSAVKRGV